MTVEHAIEGDICFIRTADDAADDESEEQCIIIGMAPTARGHSRTDVRLTRSVEGSGGEETDETVTLKVKDLLVMEEEEEDSADSADGDDSAEGADSADEGDDEDN